MCLGGKGWGRIQPCASIPLLLLYRACSEPSPCPRWARDFPSSGIRTQCRTSLYTPRLQGLPGQRKLGSCVILLAWNSRVSLFSFQECVCLQPTRRPKWELSKAILSSVSTTVLPSFYRTSVRLRMHTVTVMGRQSGWDQTALRLLTKIYFRSGSPSSFAHLLCSQQKLWYQTSAWKENCIFSCIE